MSIVLLLLFVIFLSVYLYMQLPVFGAAAKGERLKKIQKSTHFKKGAFQNIEPTPALKEGTNVFSVFYDFLFGKKPHLKPVDLIPALQQDLKNLPKEDLLIWFGHSSYLLQIDGYIYLIDPVFSKNASPVPGSNKAFPATYTYQAEDFPNIDFLLITHDHYDHLDEETLRKLKPKISKIFTGLGVGAHLERWGFSENQITEKDWYDSTQLMSDVQLTWTPARHFSGRKWKRNTSLWTSFVLKTKNYTLFLGGDSGYGSHFEKIGDQFGPFDLAILENGQYNEAWEYIHALPEQQGTIWSALRAQHVLPVHAGKFALAFHPWKEPFETVVKTGLELKIPVLTPLIGEYVYLKDLDKPFVNWWESIR